MRRVRSLEWIHSIGLGVMLKRLLIFAVIGSLTTACETHDYWLMSADIQVDSEQQILSAVCSDDLSQDLFVRYQLDYEIQNNSSEKSSEVIVAATSYVNRIARVTGQKVWHLEPEQVARGILTTSQLQLGNALKISLQCCESSRCRAKDVICPQNEDQQNDVAQVANFCFNACEDTAECQEQCPAENACSEHCQDSENENCRAENCVNSGSLSSCALYCDNDKDCLESCTPASECVDICLSHRAACFKNCLATWYQCSGNAYDPEDTLIPCELCGGNGMCQTNFSFDESHTITGENGEQYLCNLDCTAYPAVCVTGCESHFQQKSQQIDCLDNCLQQQLFWCNDYNAPVDYIDTNADQPCCFSDFCQSSLSGVVKTYDVECFNHTDCSSGHVCSDEGICVSSGSGSSCSASPRSKQPLPFVLFFLALIGIALRKFQKA